MNVAVEKAEEQLFLAKLESCTSIEDRTSFLLTSQRKHHGHWEWVASQTGISSKRWRKVIANEQRVTSDMLQAISKWLPEYVYWLMVGELPGENAAHKIPTFTNPTATKDPLE